MRLEMSRLRLEIDELKAKKYKDGVNEESGSNVYIIPKSKPDTGELRRRRHYLHEKINERFSQGELTSLMYSLGIDPGRVPGETHEENCLQFVMYCERHGIMAELLDKLRLERPRHDWKI